VNKRKYEDLLKRAEECNDHKHHGAAITTEEKVENVNEAVNGFVIEQEHQMNHSTNNQKVDSGTQTIVDKQFGAGSQPFVKMSFDTFDRIHPKKSRTDRKRKWMSFDL
jgi:hypothetical protein